MAEMHLDPTRAPAPAGPVGPVADRRRFLRLGGTGLIAAAVLAACGDDEEAPPAETGTTLPATETTLGPAQTTTPEAGAQQDAVVTRSLRSVELAMVEVYALLRGETSSLTLPEGLTLPTFSDEATAALDLMASRHASHAEALVDVVSQAGGDEVSEPNAGVLGGLVEPRLADMTTEANVLRNVLGLEEMLASTYAWGAGTLSTPALRQALMEVGAVTARHGVLLSLQVDPSGSGAVSSPRIDISGPARLADFMLVPVDGDGGDALTEPAPAEGEEGEAGDDGTEGGDTSESGDEAPSEGDSAGEGGPAGGEGGAEGGEGGAEGESGGGAGGG